MDFDPLPQQRLAIEAPLGPTLVVAGPGAGKTFCLIARVNHLITVRGFAPNRICAVTFTNKAAEEIAVRLRHTVGDRAEGITRGTIHALCLSILREHAEAAGLQKGFGVADDQYQRIILGRLGVHPERRSMLLTLFGRHRLQDYRLAPKDAQLFREYAAYLARRNMLDFDALIANTGALLRNRVDIADAIAARWDYLLVDEFQDLNPVQYDLLKRFAAPHDNFFAVGDDEQSIFSWTGADPYVLVRFRRDYGIEQPIVLDRNCRCSHQIFETARRVLAQNPQLFDKALTAERESEHEVVACDFPDEDAEATWLLEDLRADAAASGEGGGLDWGDYAILYRQHRVGEYLEGRLLRAGIPCRLARGRSLIEDDVIGYVITALRVVRDPGDPIALEAFARRVLSEHFLQEVEAALEGSVDFLTSVRTLARARPANDPDTKKLWRLVYQVENLRALRRAHSSVPALVEEILSQSIGPYRNALEEHHDELSDPAALPDAVRLAERLDQAIADDQPIAIEPQGGLEIALRGMLVAAGVRNVPSTGPATGPLKPRGMAPGLTHPGQTVRQADGGGNGLALTLFKALQLLHAKEFAPALGRYVAFDFETTDKDVATCGVVEIGAARVVHGEIVDRFHTLVNPFQRIATDATKVHGYTDADVQTAPSFSAVWPQFRAFVGEDVLIAHNGQHFDIPVLRRLATGMEGVDSLDFYDTLPLVRSLSRDSAKLEDIAARFGIDAGRGHHALDDAVTLAQVYLELERRRVVRARKAVLVNLLDYLGLGLALEGKDGAEQQLLLGLARFYTLGRYSDALEFYAAEQERTGATARPVDDVITKLGGRQLMARLRATPDPAHRFPAAVARLRALMEPSPPDPLSPSGSSPPSPLSPSGRGGTLVEDIDRLLDRVALSTSEGADVVPDRINLLTLHSTKGLEFSRVYIVGVEDFQLPGYYAATENREDEIQEARRLLYVGMTRARDRLILTRVDQRFGLSAGGNRFLDEMKPLTMKPLATREDGSHV
jgi:DNA polymerase III epsilon subunit family exonuclease